jgi:hypothetical protein
MNQGIVGRTAEHSWTWSMTAGPPATVDKVYGAGAKFTSSSTTPSAAVRRLQPQKSCIDC